MTRASTPPIENARATPRNRANANLPSGWHMSSVGAEFQIQLGKMLDAKQNVGAPRPYIGNRAIRWGRIDLDGIGSVPMTPLDLQRFRLRKNDLLVCEGGEIGRAAIWNEPISECYYQKALHRLRPRGNYAPYLMMSLLQLWTSNGHLENYVTKTSIAHLPKERLEVVPLPVPPLFEQRAIVEALSDADSLLQALKTLIAKKRAVKRAAMQRLLTGKTRLPGFGGHWASRPLGAICAFLPTASNPRSDLDDHGDVEYIHYGDVHAHAQPVLDCTVHSLPRIAARHVGSTTRLRDGDLVMVDASEDLDGVGKSVEVQGIADAPVVAGLHTILCRGDDGAWAGGFKAYLQFIPAFRTALARLAAGISVYAISARQLAAVELRLPPRPEQVAIVGVLSDMEAEITALQVRLEKTRAVKQGMMQQLLTGRMRLVVPDEPKAEAAL